MRGTQKQPTLSVGKVGGLTVDLLAATYGLPRVGWLEDENVLPVASNDTLTLLPRPDGALSTNLEGIVMRVRVGGVCVSADVYVRLTSSPHCVPYP
jgi:hypothetical protein